MRKFLIYHLPAIFYAALVVVLSSIPRPDRPEIEILLYDKVLHFTEYAIFAVLIYRSFSHIFSRQRLKYVAYFSILFLMLFAFFDETYQAHIPGRESDILDVLSDILGASLLVIVLHIRQKARFRGSNIK